MKIAVLSDIHGNRWALTAVLDDIKKRGVDLTVNLGDSVYGPLDPAGTADILMESDMIHVMGNQDQIIAEGSEDFKNNGSLSFVYSVLAPSHVEWIRQIPAEKTIEGKLHLCHGYPGDSSAYLLESIESGYPRLKPREALEKAFSRASCDVILTGHSHLQNSVAAGENRMIINPGSVGMPAYDDDLPVYHRMESGNPLAKYSIVELKKEGISLSHIQIPYSWRSASEAALENGNPHWARWLRSGWV